MNSTHILDCSWLILKIVCHLIMMTYRIVPGAAFKLLQLFYLIFVHVNNINSTQLNSTGQSILTHWCTSLRKYDLFSWLLNELIPQDLYLNVFPRHLSRSFCKVHRFVATTADFITNFIKQSYSKVKIFLYFFIFASLRWWIAPICGTEHTMTITVGSSKTSKSFWSKYNSFSR